MVNAYNLLVLLANLAVLNCQEHNEHVIQTDAAAENPSYSFSYGVSDSRTGDVKTVWEAKEGDTVKGQYSVLGPDGSMRTVEYSAGPNTGFQATVNNEDVPQPLSDIPVVESKAMRDYEPVIDYSEPEEEEHFPQRNRKRASPYESRFRDYVKRNRPQPQIDLEPSEYTHSYSIKHPYRDEEAAESEIHMSTDPNCKKKKKNENNMYTSITDLDLKKYPSFTSSSFKEDFDGYEFQTSHDFGLSSSHKYNKGKFEDFGFKQSKYTKPLVPESPSFDKYYPEDLPSRPKKKYKPYKKPEFMSDDLDDYILVPKKKYKHPLRIPDLDDYAHGMEDDYERPHFDDDDDRHHSIRGSSSAPKEVIRKVVKKKKPVINLLDMFDI